MTAPKHRPEDIEATLDEMLRETFPASDAPQLDGLPLDGAPTKRSPHPSRHAPPPDAPDPHATHASGFDVPEQRYPLGDRGHVTLATHGETVDAAFSDARLQLDAIALEKLIAALERHRPSLTQR